MKYRAARLIYDEAMRETLHLYADRPEDVVRAAAILRRGGLVAFPTETVYGLGANALSPDAVRGIFEAKQRPSWDPLIVHVAEAAAVQPMVQLSGEFQARVHTLATAFWPGPMTLLLPRAPGIPDEVTAGRAFVGVRVPAEPIARELLRQTGLPIAAPSANRFGHLSPTTAQHVFDDLHGRVDAILDGGPTLLGLESTVLDPMGTPMLVYRAGAVTPEMLVAATGVAVEMFQSAAGTTAESNDPPEALPSPGVGMRHYAPEARLVLSGPDVSSLKRVVTSARTRGERRLGVLLPQDWQMADGRDLVIRRWGRWGDAASLASTLFAGLRALERLGVGEILCPLPEPGGLRDALRDRLLKAARPR